MLNLWLPGPPYNIIHIKVHMPLLLSSHPTYIRRKGHLRTLTRATVLWYAGKAICCSHILWFLHGLQGKAGRDALTYEEYPPIWSLPLFQLTGRISGSWILIPECRESQVMRSLLFAALPKEVYSCRKHWHAFKNGPVQLRFWDVL